MAETEDTRSIRIGGTDMANYMRYGQRTTDGAQAIFIDKFSSCDLDLYPNDRGLSVTYLDRLEVCYQQWQKYLPRVKVYYAVKACGHPSILKKLHTLGAKFDTASADEKEFCLEVGAKNTDIIWSHTQKSLDQIESFKRAGIKVLAIDCMEELVKLAEHYPDCQLLIRVKGAECVAQVDLDSKFGATLDEAKLLISTALTMGLNVRGISFHIGVLPDDMTGHTGHSRTIEMLKPLYDYSLSECGHRMNILDIGGGFHGGDKTAVFKIMARNINRALEEYFPEEKGIEVIAEPGTYFADPATDIYTCIIGMKKRNDTSTTTFHYYLNDGIHGSLGKLIYLDHSSEWEIVEKTRVSPKKEGLYPSVLWGPTCGSEDIVTKEILLPKLAIGTWLMRRNFGAYSFDWPRGFNSIPRPLHVIVREGTAPHEY